MNRLKYIEQSLSIDGNDSLHTTSGMNYLSHVGSIGICGNPMLLETTGFAELKTIPGHLNLCGNDTLLNLSDFASLESIGEYLSLSGNHEIVNLHGLDKLRSVGGDFYINWNISLTTFDGLDALEEILGDGFTLSSNYKLHDLSAIENANLDSITNLAIRQNYDLKVCSIQNICDYLASGRTAQIQQNEPGCNTRNEVITACLVSTPSFQPSIELNLFPNPTQDYFNLPDFSEEIQKVEIFDMYGRRVQHWNVHQNAIDMQSFPSGIYYVFIATSSADYRGKVLKL